MIGFPPREKFAETVYFAEDFNESVEYTCLYTSLLTHLYFDKFYIHSKPIIGVRIPKISTDNTRGYKNNRCAGLGNEWGSGLEISAYPGLGSLEISASYRIGGGRQTPPQGWKHARRARSSARAVSGSAVYRKPVALITSRCKKIECVS
jgi:hypothetical protein